VWRECCSRDNRLMSLCKSVAGFDRGMELLDENDEGKSAGRHRMVDAAAEDPLRAAGPRRQPGLHAQLSARALTALAVPRSKAITVIHRAHVLTSFATSPRRRSQPSQAAAPTS